MSKKIYMSIFALVIVVLAATGIRRYYLGHQIKTTLHIAYLPIYSDLPLFVAQERGLFAKQGVNVQLDRYAASPDMGSALVTGKADLIASIAYSVALSVESRDPGKFRIFLVDSETPTGYLDSFVVLPQSGIKNLSDLRGKKVGTFPGPTALTFCKLVLQRHGLNPDKDLSVFELDSSLHLSALKAGTADALCTYEPIATQAVLDYGAQKIEPGAIEREIINPWQAGVWIASTQSLKEHPDDIHNSIAAIWEAVDYLRANPEEAKQYLEKYTTIRAQVALATPNIPFAKPSEADSDALRKQMQILLDAKVISHSVDATTLLLNTQ